MSQRAASPASRRPRLFYGWYVVIASWVMVFLINAVAVGVFFKPMLDDLKWDRARLSSVQFVGLGLITIASPFLGQLVDRYGPRLVVLATIVPQVLSSVINGLATNIWQLYLARFFYNINVLSTTQILVSQWFTRKRGLALGILSTAYPIGSMVLAPLSTQLILLWGWRPTMFFWAGVTLVTMLPLALILRDRPRDIGLAPNGDNHVQVASAQPAVAPPAPAATTDLSVRQALRTGPFWFLSVGHFLCGTGCGLIMTHIVIFATDAGYSELVGASLLSVIGALNVIGVLATGFFSDRMSRPGVLVLTHLVRTVSFGGVVAFIMLGGRSLWMLYAAMALFGFGWFTTAPLVAGLVTGIFGHARSGTILGVVTSGHFLGMAIGAYAGGIVFEATRSYLLVFAVQAGLSLLATLFSLAIKYPAGAPGDAEVVNGRGTVCC